LATAWARAALDPVPVMVSAPVVASTVPVTLSATAVTSGSKSILAAERSTAVLPSSWTGSGRVTVAPVAVPVPVAVELVEISISEVDW
jgi:hypothetical protein